MKIKNTVFVSTGTRLISHVTLNSFSTANQELFPFVSSKISVVLRVNQRKRAGSICLLYVFRVQLNLIVDVGCGSFRSARAAVFPERARAEMFSHSLYLRLLEGRVHEDVKVNFNERGG